MDLSQLFIKQNLMRKVLWSLVPITAYGVYLFGLRVLMLLAVVTVAGVLTEYLFLKWGYKKSPKVSEAVLVSSILYTLTLPPAIPAWMAVVGIIFGVFFGKCVFGGFGKYVFNPALLGRCFIFISFPVHMTAHWSHPFMTFPGGLTRWGGAADSLTGATPLTVGDSIHGFAGHLNLFFGSIPGSIGETSTLLLLVAAAYLIVTRTASWKIMAAGLVSFLVFSSAFFLVGSTGTPPSIAVLSGSILFGLVFMATDPISAPKLESSKLVYGVLIGFLAIVIRVYGNFTEGVMFSILIANTFVPLIDRHMQALGKRPEAQPSSGKKVAS